MFTVHEMARDEARQMVDVRVRDQHVAQIMQTDVPLLRRGKYVRPEVDAQRVVVDQRRPPPRYRPLNARPFANFASAKRIRKQLRRACAKKFHFVSPPVCFWGYVGGHFWEKVSPKPPTKTFVEMVRV